MLNSGWRSPAIMPNIMASITLKINGALVPIIAAPANTPYIKSLILIFPWITADKASEVTTHAEIPKYAAIIPFSAKKGVVFTAVVAPTLGTSKKMQG